jgi:DNA mismatch repair protein MSH6
MMSRQGNSNGPSYVTPPSNSSSVSGGGGGGSIDGFCAASPRTPATVVVAGTPLPYVEKAVNPAGAHVHNHLNFVRNPRDANNRPPSHPDYDGRTLRVVEADWKKHHHGKGMTDAVKQWWDLKSQYFDTVLLFKTGKFYEMFHMDADVGVQVCSTCIQILLLFWQCA